MEEKFILYWLNVSYAMSHYDIDSTDRLITGVLGIKLGEGYDSGAGFGARDLNFPYDTARQAEQARLKLQASGIPVVFEAWVS